MTGTPAQDPVAGGQERETYRVPAAHIGSLRAGIERLSDRARKLGAPPITLTELRVEDVVETKSNPLDGLAEPTGRVLRFHIVEVIGEAPKFAGWTFVASLDLLEGGTVLRAVPGETVPVAYRQAAPGCDHCRLARQRVKHYLLRHDDGRFVQVGSSCLLDFLGHDSPDNLARLASYLMDARDLAGASERDPDDEGGFGGGGGGGSSLIMLSTFLAYAAAEIRVHGWVSRSAARESERKTATANLALTAMFAKPHERHNFPQVTDADRTEAEAAIEWGNALAGDNDYVHNVRVVSAQMGIEYRHTGIAASVVAGYQREQSRLRLEARAGGGAGAHFGTVGKREDFVLTVLDIKRIEGQWGLTELFKLVDAAGNLAAWFSTARTDMEVGKTYKIKGTVKAHDSYGGKPQTTLTRCKVLGEVKAEVAAPVTPATGGN